MIVRVGWKGDAEMQVVMLRAPRLGSCLTAITNESPDFSRQYSQLAWLAQAQIQVIVRYVGTVSRKLHGMLRYYSINAAI